jgi:peroxiredoxin
MKTTRLILISLSLWLITSSSAIIRRKFPSFELKDAQGASYTNAIFKGKKTMVVVNYLSCPYSLILMKDLDSLSAKIDTSTHQIIVMLEHSERQVKEFYDTAISGPSGWRKDYKIQATEYLILAQCDVRKLRKNPKKASSCNPISKKLFTRASPTSYLIDENGRMQKKSKGYIPLSTMSERMKWLNAFIEND